MPKWMELLAQVPGEIAEEASARLIESGASAVESRDARPGAAVLVTHFLLEEGATRKLRAAEAALADLGIGPGAIAVRNIEEVDWVTRSRGMFGAREYGERLWVRPPWEESAPPPGREEIVLEPSLAFGTGRHATTALCLLAIEKFCAEKAPRRFLDIGCGTGILSAAALRLGAAEALALDLDPQAADAARKLAEENGLAGRMRVIEGTLEPDALGEWWGKVDLLAANIFLDPLREMAPRIAEALASGGRGVLSGIGFEQADILGGIAEAAGLAIAGRRRLEEWAAVEIEKP
ncbi:MAG: 50S ribosomal protein L11 methyltransferase [bacterium]